MANRRKEARTKEKKTDWQERVVQIHDPRVMLQGVGGGWRGDTARGVEGVGGSGGRRVFCWQPFCLVRAACLAWGQPAVLPVSVT